MYKSQERWAEAIGAYNQDLIICREFKNRIGEGITLENIALLLVAQNNIAEALTYAQQAVQVLESTQAKAELAKARATLERLETATRMES